MNFQVACIVLNYNDVDTTCHLVDKISSYNVFNYIVIIDNCSTDNSLSVLEQKYKKNNKVIVKETQKNGGYGYGNNYGIKLVHNVLNMKYAIVTNPDVDFSESSIKRLVEVAQNKNAAIVSGVQKVNNKEIKNRAWKIPTILSCTVSDTRFARLFSNYYPNSYFIQEVSQVDCVPGAMFLVDTNKFLDVGGFDENMFLYCEETTIGFKLKEKGYKVYIVNNIYYDHQHSVSINKSIPDIKLQRSMIYKNRLYFMKTYLKENKIMYQFSKAFFKLKLRKIK